VDGKRKSSERTLSVVLEHGVEVDLFDSVDVARKERRDFLAGAIGRL